MHTQKNTGGTHTIAHRIAQKTTRMGRTWLRERHEKRPLEMPGMRRGFRVWYRETDGQPGPKVAYIPPVTKTAGAAARATNDAHRHTNTQHLDHERMRNINVCLCRWSVSTRRVRMRGCCSAPTPGNRASIVRIRGRALMCMSNAHARGVLPHAQDYSNATTRVGGQHHARESQFARNDDDDGVTKPYQTENDTDYTAPRSAQTITEPELLEGYGAFKTQTHTVFFRKYLKDI